MKDRLDPLIRERAPWLFAKTPMMGILRHAFHKLLSYDKTIALANTLEHTHAHGLMTHVSRMLVDDLSLTGLHHIPRHGPALVVANHPTGIADGLMLYHAIAPLRPDLFFYANADILRVVPQLEPMIAPVEWRAEKRSHSRTRETMAYTRKAMDDGRLGIIFPSGRLAKRRGLRLYEREWMASAAMIARKFDLPVVPINVQARNSALFYLFDKIHPTLRDITLFHEMLNKARQPYRIKIGEPISASSLPKRSDAVIDMLKRTTLALGACDKSGLSMMAVTRKPRWN